MSPRKISGAQQSLYKHKYDEMEHTFVSQPNGVILSDPVAGQQYLDQLSRKLGASVTDSKEVMRNENPLRQLKSERHKPSSKMYGEIRDTDLDHSYRQATKMIENSISKM